MNLFSLFFLFTITAFPAHSKELCNEDLRVIGGNKISNWSIYSPSTKTCTDELKFTDNTIETNWAYTSNGKIVNTVRKGNQETQVISMYQIIPTMIQEGKIKVLERSNPTGVSYNFFQGLSFEFNSTGKLTQAQGCKLSGTKLINCPDRLLITYETLVKNRDLKILKANITDGKTSCTTNVDLTKLNTEKEVLAKIKSTPACSKLIFPNSNSSTVVFQPFKSKPKSVLEIIAEENKAKASKNKLTVPKEPTIKAVNPSNTGKGYHVPGITKSKKGAVR